MRVIPVKLTDEQVEAVKAAFPNSKANFSEMLRDLIASGLALYQIQWPPTPEHGGRRNGAGRKAKSDKNSIDIPSVVSRF